MSEADDRIPPHRVRTTKLQEVQLPALAACEQHAVQMYREIGLGPEHIEARNDTGIAVLTKTNDVIVAEADHETVGYLAWADEAPGVAVLTQVCVAPDHQRFGIATRLLRELGDTASGHGLQCVVAIVWPTAPWVLGFLATRGFMPVDQGVVPEPVAEWCGSRGEELILDGQIILWRDTDHLGHVPGLPKPN
jgi:amino-acid N-acetyltransferase